MPVTQPCPSRCSINGSNELMNTLWYCNFCECSEIWHNLCTRSFSKQTCTAMIDVHFVFRYAMMYSENFRHKTHGQKFRPTGNFVWTLVSRPTDMCLRGVRLFWAAKEWRMFATNESLYCDIAIIILSLQYYCNCNMNGFECWVSPLIWAYFYAFTGFYNRKGFIWGFF